LLALPAAPAAADAVFRNWVTLRDSGLVRQERDFSCGLAALASLLSYDYRAPVSEQTLLDQLLAHDPSRAGLIGAGGVSLADLAWLAEERGFKPAGLSVTPEALARLRWPALAYLEVAGMPHFVVLREAHGDGSARIADPSVGNRWLSRAEFFPRFFGAEDGRGRLLLLPPPPGGAPARTVPRRALLGPPVLF
jgi:predicted double-glycine peptidase